MSKKHNVKRFTGVLSTCMYPDVVENYPMTEKDVHLGPPANANFSYGFTKRSLLVGIEAYNKQYGTEYNYLIPCNLYGEYDHFDDPNKCHFITALIRKIIDSENEGRDEITLFGTGSPLRQFMYAEENNIKDMAEITLKALGKDMKVVFDTDKPDGQYRKTVSCKKMLESVGDFEFTKLEDGVKKVYNEVIKKYGK
jgi:GDP-L-fucose synthase